MHKLEFVNRLLRHQADRYRWTWSILVFVSCLQVTPTAKAQQSDDLRSPLPKVLVRYCFECHDSSTAEGEFDLEALQESRPDSSSVATVLKKVRRVVAQREMPPEDASSLPSPEEQREIVSWADGKLHALAVEHKDDPGRVVMPRLTPAEYRNVIRDLSGGVVTDAGRYLPNEGGAGEGFSNVGEAQGMNAAQYEKYLEAARAAMKHLRVSPRSGMVWRAVQRDSVDRPDEARTELVNDIIAWHGEQQIKWGNRHLRDLKWQYGLSHGLYLEAAWRYRWREELGNPNATFSDIVHDFDAEISPLILEKWWDLLQQQDPSRNAAGVIAQWKVLPRPVGDANLSIRDLCRKIENWVAEVKDDGQPENTYAPAYELSFRDDSGRASVKAAAKTGRWPFEIEVGDAQALFLVLTDSGDGGNDDYGSWHQGQFEMADGSTRNWSGLVTARRLDGEQVEWGYHPKREGRGPQSVGVHAPAILKFDVPAGVLKFRVEFVITDGNARQSSVQALVLKEAPPAKHRRIFPKRYVFGGSDSRRVGKQAASFDAFEREIRKRNIPSANLTKVGLNAERNVLFDWTETELRYIGGPWSEQPEDEPRPLIPYYFTAEETRRVATDKDLQRLANLRAQLAAIVQEPQQDLLEFCKSRGWKTAEEGRLPPNEFVRALDAVDRQQYKTLRNEFVASEQYFAGQARSLIKRFATRAWRRPVTETELQVLMQLYRDARSSGLSYDAATKNPLLAIFASPHFLYRHPLSLPNEGAYPTATVPLDNYELASRLSFFLWATIPDDTLLQLAAEDKLADSVVLRSQVRRMLSDPRARSLTDVFAAQLWHFGGFEHFSGPDSKRFADFTPSLREAMLAEVELLLSDLFQNDRPLTNLIGADYTFLNDNLAEHYGLKGEYDDSVGRNVMNSHSELALRPGFRRVKLPPEHPRGGIHTMALFLTKTSLPLRTSPVQRGVWVMEDLLGREMPDPPAGVPSISADETNSRGLSIREQLESHRTQASCANCHDKIDPLGIALEQFDAIGRWRTQLRSGEMLSVSAKTHDGMELKGADGLRDYLDQHRDEVFAHFNRKLLGYALGRSVGPGDAMLLEKMHDDLRQSGYRFSSLVNNIVLSQQFRSRSIQNGEASAVQHEPLDKAKE